VQRFASVIGIKPENRAEYERLHAAVWPDVLAQIAKSNIRNYSIYRYGELLFSYFEYVGNDFDADMAKMGEDPTTQKWWDVCKPLQTPVSDRAQGEWWAAIPEVFHVE
jgi:L-rhamnose mutarotase